jgi:hypothetical protein
MLAVDERQASVTVTNDGSTYRLDGEYDEATAQFAPSVEEGGDTGIPDEVRFADATEITALAGQTIVKAWIAPAQGAVFAARLANGQLLEMNISI